MLTRLFKKIFSRHKGLKRERLLILFTITTDKSKYIIYNTQTIPNDCLNVEILRNENEIILESKLIDEAYGTMGGDSFYSFVCSMLNILNDYINKNNEVITEAIDHKSSNAFKQFVSIYNFKNLIEP